MAYVRQLESGLWAATVYTPAGRITESREYRWQIVKWANDLESSIKEGDFIDPRGGKVTFAEIWDLYGDSRELAEASRQRDASHWRCHVEPYWGWRRVGPVLKPDITKWVSEMKARKTDGVDDPVGAATIEGSVGLLRSLLEITVDARLRRDNPARGVKTPPRPAHLDRVFDADEELLLVDNLNVRFPLRPEAGLFVETLFDTGLRYQEVGALDRHHVNLRLRAVVVGPVLGRNGVIKPTPKTVSGERTVPIGDAFWPRFREHVMTVPPGGVIFTSLEGGNLTYSNWHDRVWSKGLLREVEMTPDEIEVWKAERRAAGNKHPWRRRWVREVPLLADPQPTPHDIRHTFGTRLGEAGVPVHEIMDAMGHSNLQSTQRYIHATDARFDRIREAQKMARRR